MGESLQEPTPIALGVIDSTHLIATRPVAIQMTMLQFDARTIAPVGAEADLDFGLQCWVILKIGADIPREEQARGRFPREYAAPLTRASIVAALVPAAPDAGSITASTALALPIL